MRTQTKASKLAREALDLWSQGQAERALPLYQEALLLADPLRDNMAMYHGEFAGALTNLGRHAEAREQYELALAVEMRESTPGDNSGVSVARYFLAQHFLGQQEPLAALETVEPAIQAGMALQWILLYSKTLALHALGMAEQASTCAHLTLSLAPSEKKRTELQQQFTDANIIC